MEIELHLRKNHYNSGFCTHVCCPQCEAWFCLLLISANNQLFSGLLGEAARSFDQCHCCSFCWVLRVRDRHSCKLKALLWKHYTYTEVGIPNLITRLYSGTWNSSACHLIYARRYNFFILQKILLLPDAIYKCASFR